ncbi:protein-methionine-sulfoxide reductase heme-binding subunit MsrQ [Pseudooceanicola sp. CBS1P-1]|uniref:Protein-methionine-sulfoxide reductase heme-binding subunit MsrQ n=2 Tax=Paracoccaceae TaxID=31989 RepID=A0A6L7GBP3_9RHOB|nr:protein-methionine-sulfoxide reductase heme-binding subunit MsrQ [Pseudooceanicola endophyticus]MXN20938.1 protein-methionine-sulfoxide reductase heme-binding subunit MsrQ [Pseudooceanicola albus]
MPASLSGPVNRVLRPVPAWPLYILAVLPPAWLVWGLFQGRLGVDPVKTMEHQMGLWALWLIIAGLAVTPIRRILGVSFLKYRRAIGLVAFFYILLHLLIWLVLDVQIPAQILADLTKRPYIILGMAAFVLLIPLAVTSNAVSIRRLGRNWRRLHLLVYPAAVLGGLHYVILVKGIQMTPILYLLAILGLLAFRLPWTGRRPR